MPLLLLKFDFWFLVLLPFHYVLDAYDGCGLTDVDPSNQVAERTDSF
jgi:hypothetical protein